MLVANLPFGSVRYLTLLYLFGCDADILFSCCIGVGFVVQLHKVLNPLHISVCGQQQTLMPIMSPMTKMASTHIAIIPNVLILYVPGYSC